MDSTRDLEGANNLLDSVVEPDIRKEAGHSAEEDPGYTPYIVRGLE